MTELVKGYFHRLGNSAIEPEDLFERKVTKLHGWWCALR
ncbi:Uncharacterised protein [Legionella maceachernii]|nr:Uncharacterised protein [Legionella maceachernii]